MDPRLAAAAAASLLLLLALVCPATTAPSQHLSARSPRDKGCYYLLRHYANGAQIETQEPCLNCSCVNSMLMCYLRVCPYVRPLADRCVIEKVAGDCCPRITCPDVPPAPEPEPVDAWPEPAPDASAEPDVGPGCFLQERHYREGAQLPPDPEQPCQTCYCIRNASACVSQECSLGVPGCLAVHAPRQCCPVRYNCSAAAATTVPPDLRHPQAQLGCRAHGRLFLDGEAVPSKDPCEHCYCMKHEVVCAVQDCKAPCEGCTPVASADDRCCPHRYQCPPTADGTGTGTGTGDRTTTSESMSETSETSETSPASVVLGQARRDEDGAGDGDGGSTRRPGTQRKMFPSVGVIPGEGICRYEGRVYQNSDEVRSADPCVEFCMCINSVVYCDETVCEAAPSGLNCSRSQTPGQCCPRFHCRTAAATTTDESAAAATTETAPTTTTSAVQSTSAAQAATEQGAPTTSAAEPATETAPTTNSAPTTAMAMAARATVSTTPPPATTDTGTSSETTTTTTTTRDGDDVAGESSSAQHGLSSADSSTPTEAAREAAAGTTPTPAEEAGEEAASGTQAGTSLGAGTTEEPVAANEVGGGEPAPDGARADTTPADTTPAEGSRGETPEEMRHETPHVEYEVTSESDAEPSPTAAATSSVARTEAPPEPSREADPAASSTATLTPVESGAGSEPATTAGDAVRDQSPTQTPTPADEASTGVSSGTPGDGDDAATAPTDAGGPTTRVPSGEQRQPDKSRGPEEQPEPAEMRVSTPDLEPATTGEWSTATQPSTQPASADGSPISPVATDASTTTVTSADSNSAAETEVEVAPTTLAPSASTAAATAPSASPAAADSATSAEADTSPAPSTTTAAVVSAAATADSSSSSSVSLAEQTEADVAGSTLQPSAPVTAPVTAAATEGVDSSSASPAASDSATDVDAEVSDTTMVSPTTVAPASGDVSPAATESAGADADAPSSPATATATAKSAGSSSSVSQTEADTTTAAVPASTAAADSSALSGVTTVSVEADAEALPTTSVSVATSSSVSPTEATEAASSPTAAATAAPTSAPTTTGAVGRSSVADDSEAGVEYATTVTTASVASAATDSPAPASSETASSEAATKSTERDSTGAGASTAAEPGSTAASTTSSTTTTPTTTEARTEEEEQDTTCVYQGRRYQSAEQVPRPHACDFCFCFRGDVLCLQQSCPPPVPGCRQTALHGFCCPRFECPANATVSATADAGLARARRAPPPTDCLFQGRSFAQGQRVPGGRCLQCQCRAGGLVRCDPRPCAPSPPLLVRLHRRRR